MLQEVGKAVTDIPKDFTPHRLIKKLFQQRRDMITGDARKPLVDWGMAETLAFGTLLSEGGTQGLATECSRHFRVRVAVVCHGADKQAWDRGHLGKGLRHCSTAEHLQLQCPHVPMPAVWWAHHKSAGQSVAPTATTNCRFLPSSGRRAKGPFAAQLGCASGSRELQPL